MLKNPLQIIEQDGLVLYHENVISDEQIKLFYEELLNNINWENERVVMFGKEIITKRKVAP
jgi:hypothetical protein